MHTILYLDARHYVFYLTKIEGWIRYCAEFYGFKAHIIIKTSQPRR